MWFSDAALVVFLFFQGQIHLVFPSACLQKSGDLWKLLSSIPLGLILKALLHSLHPLLLPPHPGNPLPASVVSANLMNNDCDYLLNTGYHTGCYQGIVLAV